MWLRLHLDNCHYNMIVFHLVLSTLFFENKGEGNEKIDYARGKYKDTANK